MEAASVAFTQNKYSTWVLNQWEEPPIKCPSLSGESPSFSSHPTKILGVVTMMLRWQPVSIENRHPFLTMMWKNTLCHQGWWWNSNAAAGINETTKTGKQRRKSWPKYTAEADLEMTGMRSFWWKQKTEMLHVEKTNKELFVFNLVTGKCDLLTLDFWHCDHSVPFVSRPWRLGKELPMMCVDVCFGSVDIREWMKSKRKQRGQRGQKKGWTWVLPFCSGDACWTWTAWQGALNSNVQPVLKKSIYTFQF